MSRPDPSGFLTLPASSIHANELNQKGSAQEAPQQSYEFVNNRSHGPTLHRGEVALRAGAVLTGVVPQPFHVPIGTGLNVTAEGRRTG